MSSNEIDKLFRFWLAEGYKFRMKDSREMQADPRKYKLRLKHEVEVITSIEGFTDYFLLVSDLVRWAKDNGIMVGAGRGSAAASLCCWFLRITEIDPLMYPMLFERFISADRPDLPDVDIDFEDERRLEVIEYAQNKYGFDRVANILTFTRYKGRNSLDDIARVYRIPAFKIDAIKSRLVERADGHPRFADTLQDTYDQYEDVAEIVRQTPELKLAIQLEGNYRTAGIHPCGIVIGGTTLTDVTALYEKQSGNDRGSGVAYDKKDGEYLGLLKVDFLSLTTLSAVRTTLDNLPGGMTIDDYYRIPLDDPQVYQAFRAGDVLGIFQFEGHTTRQVLKAVAPTKFMDLVDVNALSRPGGDDKAYVAAKNSGQMPNLNQAAAQHVTWTYGTIVYQEQILLILRDYGNFPVADVNRVRKIISAKEDQSVLNEYFQRFAEGAAAHGDTSEQAQLIWNQILNATGYAFCVTGDTLVERAGKGGNNPDDEPTISIKQLYDWQQTRGKSGPGGNAAYRRGDLRLLSMWDDGRIRPNRLQKIHDPVPYRCTKITTQSGKSITVSNDHRMLTDKGYKLTVELELGTNLLVDMGKEHRYAENALEHTSVRAEPMKPHDEHNPAYLDGRTAYREVWERDQATCQHCGKPWDGTSHGLEYAHLMTLEHFEGDYKRYHSSINIALLCNSCHKTYDYQVQGTRRPRWSRGRATGLDPIVSLEDAGIQDVFDVSMSDDPHNYIGNGFVNHNNISHAACYSDLAYRQMWLKVYHPEFYLGQLLKCPSDPDGLERRRRLIVEAEQERTYRKPIHVRSVSLLDSQANWALVDGQLVAGFTAIHGIGPANAEKIVAYRDSLLRGNELIKWEDLLEVDGIGPGRLEKIQSFSEDKDPFNVMKTKWTLDACRRDFDNNEFPGVAVPTHNALQINTPEEFVTFMGILQARQYKDVVAQRLKYGNKGNGHDETALTREAILENITDPHLLKYATLDAIDEYDEPVRIRVSRKKYPKYKAMISQARLGVDVIVASGYVSEFGGLAIQVSDIVFIDPEA